MKKTLIVASLVLVCIFAGLSLIDFLGFLPSLPRALGNCKAEANKQLAGLHRYDDMPIDDPRNNEWFAKHAELLSSCMESHGYKLDDSAAAKFVTTLMKNTPGAGAYGNDEARQFEEFWHRRWFWE